jgi:hypothetical protein
MKKAVRIAALLASLLVCTSARAQDKSNSTDKAKPITPVRLQIVLTESDGEKKIASLPYSFLMNSESGGHTAFSNFTRVGVRVPVAGVGKDGQAQFVDVGSNIDCGVQTEEDGRFSVRLNFERSSLYFQGRNDDKGAVRTAETGQPYIPTIRTQTLVLVKDGQTTEALTAADPLNGHVFRISVTLNVQK